MWLEVLGSLSSPEYSFRSLLLIFPFHCATFPIIFLCKHDLDGHV